MTKSFENLSDIEDYDKPWWVDYDGDIEEERRKIIERVSEIEEPEKRQEKYEDGWLVVLEFNATLTAKVISWRSVTHMCFLAFSHQY